MVLALLGPDSPLLDFIKDFSGSQIRLCVTHGLLSVLNFICQTVGHNPVWSRDFQVCFVLRVLVIVEAPLYTPL